jgi:hypothetical protein
MGDPSSGGSSGDAAAVSLDNCTGLLPIFPSVLLAEPFKTADVELRTPQRLESLRALKS